MDLRRGFDAGQTALQQKEKIAQRIKKTTN
jgi:hypothetical protein